jgi:hypothetical protein
MDLITVDEVVAEAGQLLGDGGGPARDGGEGSGREGVGGEGTGRQDISEGGAALDRRTVPGEATA